MKLIEFDSLEDPRIVDYNGSRDPELARKKNLFLAESNFVLETLVTRSRFHVKSVLLCKTRLEVMKPVLDQLPADCPVYTADAQICDKLAGFKVHRSCLAAGDRGEPLDADTMLSSLPPGRRTVLVLEGVNNHDNIGSIFRNAAGFGIDAVLLDLASADPLYRKAIRVSVASTLTVPYARVENTSAALSLLQKYNFVSWALTPKPIATDLEVLAAVIPQDRRLALWLGTEGPGLSDDTISSMQPAKIAMAEGPDALNVACASAVALYVATRTKPASDDGGFANGVKRAKSQGSAWASAFTLSQEGSGSAGNAGAGAGHIE